MVEDRAGVINDQCDQSVTMRNDRKLTTADELYNLFNDPERLSGNRKKILYGVKSVLFQFYLEKVLLPTYRNFGCIT